MMSRYTRLHERAITRGEQEEDRMASGVVMARMIELGLVD
jgi:hypothetical protein